MTTPLPPRDSATPDEKLPGEFELAALYRQLPQSEPGPALDAAVLHAAAQAVAPDEEGPTVLRERRKAAREPGDWVHPKKPTASTAATPLPAPSGRKRHHWPIALGSAAALVLAVGLGWRMRDLPPPTPPSASNAAPAEVSAAAPTPHVAARSAEMPAAMPAPPPPEPPRQPPPRMAAAPQAQTIVANASRKAAVDKSTRRASSEAYAAGGLASAAPPAVEESVSDSATKTARSAQAEMAPTAASTPVAMAAAPAPVTADTTTAADASDTPAQELDKISQLFAQGRDDEARQRLAAFQHAYPQWELPPELRAKLRKP